MRAVSPEKKGKWFEVLMLMLVFFGRSQEKRGQVSAVQVEHHGRGS